MEDYSLCRLCAERKNDLMEIYSGYGKDHDLEAKILSCFELDVSSSNPLPKSVCVDCCESLEATWIFKQAVDKAQHCLKTLFQRRKTRSSVQEEVEVKLESKDWYEEPKSESDISLKICDDDPDFEDDVKLDLNYDDLNEYVPIKHKRKTRASVRKNTTEKIRRKRHKSVSNDILIEMWGLDRIPDDSETLNEILNDVDEGERTTDGDGLLKPFKYRQSWRGYPWVCTKCGKRHHEVHRLRKHWDKIHKEQLDFNCADCDMNITNYYDFVTHVRTHVDRKHLKFCCDICCAYYESTAQLNAHRWALHPPDRPHHCLKCFAGFETKHDLGEHGALHKKSCRLKVKKETQAAIAQDKDKSCVFLCEICNKTFKSKGNLAIHTLIHTGRSRDHTCDKCGKAFYNKGTLTSHLLQHEDARPYKCLICGAAFKSRPHLRNHAGVHVTVKPFSCDQCGRCFRLRQQLKSHMIIHTDALPYSCSFCNKAFRFKTILTQHLRQHTGAKPYNCTQCQRDFTNWPNYNKHMKRRHGIDTAKKRFPSADGMVPMEPQDGKLIILLEDSGTPAHNQSTTVQRAFEHQRQNIVDRSLMQLQQEQRNMVPAEQASFRIL